MTEILSQTYDFSNNSQNESHSKVWVIYKTIRSPLWTINNKYDYDITYVNNYNTIMTIYNTTHNNYKYVIYSLTSVTVCLNE